MPEYRVRSDMILAQSTVTAVIDAPFPQRSRSLA
jgi:hypothetical protein